ncbi:hypothetical protein QCA50_000313 [Cerrena zonata]|uniref:Pentatricopeptide repeat domain-containing protein n=1 Tax=Cerrena zonata TaxID=2478898 RepID=A0AAW0GSP2_9APHY
MSLVSKQCLKHIRIPKSCRHVPRAAVVRNIHASQVTGFTLAIPTLDLSSFPSSSRTHDTRESVQDLRLAELLQDLDGGSPDPTRVWRSYRKLLTVELPANVPLVIHQRVLRACSPSSKQMRAILADQLKARSRPSTPHQFEGRFQSIIHNMQEAGYTPDLNDFYYILEQFASVGHHVGSRRVMAEMEELGIDKTPKVYALGLESLCRALTLPLWHEERPRFLKEFSTDAQKLLDEMWKANIPVSPMCVDLAVRVFKETMDMDGLEKVLKVVYGIDLAYPDRPPVEFWDKGRTKPVEGDFISPLSGPQPFSTAALNTTLDILGRLGEVSKMVQLFEVVTNPLPQGSSPVPSSSFDDDDDDFGVNSPAVAPFTLPHAIPNTTTFYTLIRWLVQADHPILVRHYCLQAYHLDRALDTRIRRLITQKVNPVRIEDLTAPRMSMNRNILQAVMSLANRNKNRNLELLRWISYRIERVLKNKRSDVEFYTKYRKLLAAGHLEHLSSPEDSSTNPPFSDTSSSLSQPQSEDEQKTPAAFHLDAAKNPPFVPSPKDKPLDLDLHLTLLQRDIEDIVPLQQHCLDILGRNTQRLKERLGRRVWAEKDVYLRVPDGRRKIAKAHWPTLVNFASQPQVPKEEAEDDLSDLSGPSRRRRWQRQQSNLAFRRGRRGFMTSAVQQSPHHTS